MNIYLPVVNLYTNTVVV